MKKYKAYKAKKLKLPRQLLFLLAVAVIIFIIAVIVGNILKSKVDKIKTGSDETTFSLETEKSSLESLPQSVFHDSALSGVAAGCFDPEGITDEMLMREKVAALIAEGYNAVSYNVCSDDTTLTYASPAMEAMTRLPASEKLFPCSLLEKTVACVKGSGMRMCAILPVSENIQADCAVAGELYAMGFEEITVTGFEKLTPSDEAVEKINGYLGEIKKYAPVDYGVLLTDKVLSDSQNAPFVEKIYTGAAFLAVDMRGYAPEDAARLAQDLKGSFRLICSVPFLTEKSRKMQKP